MRRPMIRNSPRFCNLSIISPLPESTIYEFMFRCPAIPRRRAHSHSRFQFLNYNPRSPSSRWLSGSIKPQIEPARRPTPIGAHFLRSARALKRDCCAENASFAGNTPVSVYRADATALPIGDNSVDAVITSPPYWKMYDYFDVHRLTYLAFGWRYQASRQIGRFNGIERDGAGFVAPMHMKHWYARHFRQEDTGNGRSLRAYWCSMRLHIAEVKRILRSGGVVAYAIANPV